MLHDILNHGHLQWHSHINLSLNRDLVTELDLITEFDLITKFWEVSIEYLKRVQLVNIGRLLLQTPGPVPFGNCICSNIENILFWMCHVSGLWISKRKRRRSDSVSLYFHFLHLWFPLKWHQGSMNLWPWLTFMLNIAFHDFFLPWAHTNTSCFLYYYYLNYRHFTTDIQIYLNIYLTEFRWCPYVGPPFRKPDQRFRRFWSIWKIQLRYIIYYSFQGFFFKHM